MHSLCEFRIEEEYAHLLFRPDQGKRLGDDIRKITLSTDDPRFQEVGRLDRELSRSKNRAFFYGWDIEYRYSPAELESAALFHLQITAAFEPPGELCGTVYDESQVCAHCGVGRRQVSELILDLRKAPKTRHIARTIADDEWIVSQRLAELMMDANLTGFALRPVRHKARYKDGPVDLKQVPSGRKLLRQAKKGGVTTDSWEFWVWLNRPAQKDLWNRAVDEHAELLAEKARRQAKPVPVWYQLVVTANPVPMVAPTLAGIDPFNDDADGEYRCPLGHVLGLNLLSEISVARDSWDESNVACTSNMVGVRRGVLVPRPMLLISPRFYRLLRDEKIKGYNCDVAYLV